MIAKKQVPPLPSNYNNISVHFENQPSTLRRKSVCSNKDSKRINLDNSTIKDSSTAQRDILKILQEQNINLKNQNQYLMGQVRIIADKQRHHEQMQKKYQSIIEELKNKNFDLEDRIEELNRIMASEIEKFDEKIKEMVFYHQQNFQSNILKVQRQQVDKAKYLSLSAFIDSDEIKQKQNSQTMSSRKLFEEFGQQFNRLQQQSREQKEHEKRKYIRRRMTQLAEKMQELRKSSNEL